MHYRLDPWWDPGAFKLRSKTSWSMRRWRWYGSLFSNADLLASIYNSFYVALIATSITLVIGVPAAICGVNWYFLPQNR